SCRHARQRRDADSRQIPGETARSLGLHQQPLRQLLPAEFCIAGTLENQRVRHWRAQVSPLGHQELAAPQAALVVGGGFSFRGDAQSWLNRNAFAWRTSDAVQALSLLLPQHRVAQPVPGQTFVMDKGVLVDVESSTPFVSPIPADQWPS